MNIGDAFDTSGYDVICTIPTYEGTTRLEVLNNNHNYYLVVMRPSDLATGEWAPKAELVYEAPYDEDVPAFMAWLACLSMAWIFAKHISEQEYHTEVREVANGN